MNSTESKTESKIKYYPAKPMYVPPDSELFKSLDMDTSWLCEPKINGKRVLIFNKVIWSRLGNVVTNAPEIQTYIDKCYGDVDLDGELVNKNGVEELWLFDIMRLCDKDLRNLPLKDRKKILLKYAWNTSKIKIVPWAFENKIQFYNNIILDCANQKQPFYEGIVMKKIDSEYKYFFNGSKEISEWLKVKPKNTFNGR